MYGEGHLTTPFGQRRKALRDTLRERGNIYLRLCALNHRFYLSSSVSFSPPERARCVAGLHEWTRDQRLGCPSFRHFIVIILPDGHPVAT